MILQLSSSFLPEKKPHWVSENLAIASPPCLHCCFSQVTWWQLIYLVPGICLSYTFQAHRFWSLEGQAYHSTFVAGDEEEIGVMMRKQHILWHFHKISWLTCDRNGVITPIYDLLKPHTDSESTICSTIDASKTFIGPPDPTSMPLVSTNPLPSVSRNTPGLSGLMAVSIQGLWIGLIILIFIGGNRSSFWCLMRSLPHFSSPL